MAGGRNSLGTAMNAATTRANDMANSKLRCPIFGDLNGNDGGHRTSLRDADTMLTSVETIDVSCGFLRSARHSNANGLWQLAGLH